MAIKAAVIGLGSMGQGLDYDDPTGQRVLTHARAFANHPEFELVGGVDPGAGNRAKFALRYGVPAFATVDELYAKLAPEVVSLAVPTEHHHATFLEVIDHAPKAIILEKPIAPELARAKEIVAKAKLCGCLLLVNYMRRFEPGVQALKQAVARGDAGDIFKGTVWYSKGIANNGSHFIDLLRYVLGEVSAIEVLDAGPAVKDPEPDLKLRFGDATVYFLAGREQDFSIKEITLVGTKGLVEYTRGGERIHLTPVKASELFGGYTVLSDGKNEIGTDFTRYQYHVVQALHRALTGKAPLASDGHSALATAEVVDQVLELLKEKARGKEASAARR